jgi:hypothetical protein
MQTGTLKQLGPEDDIAEQVAEAQTPSGELHCVMSPFTDFFAANSSGISDRQLRAGLLD